MNFRTTIIPARLKTAISGTAFALAACFAAMPGPAQAQMGPDYWQVTGVASNDHLNIRSGPGTSNRVVALAPNGAVFRNLGCRGEGNARWCHLETPDGSTSESFEDQVAQTWANILALLNEGGMGIEDIVKIAGYVVGAENFPAYAAGRKKVLGDARPASTAIIVPALAMPEWLVEIEAIAAK